MKRLARVEQEGTHQTAKHEDEARTVVTEANASKRCKLMSAGNSRKVFKQDASQKLPVQDTEAPQNGWRKFE